MERLRNARSDYRKFRGFGGKIDTIQGQIEQAEQELSHAETEKAPLEQINSDVEDFQQKVYDFWVHFWGQIGVLKSYQKTAGVRSMTKKTTSAYRASKEETIPINKLHPFSNHPFHIRHDLEFSELVDSISESGIITPIIVRPKVGVGYEVISGHRRWEACKELGIESIPARVEYIDDDEATILMVNSNIQREHVLPSEKAFAYKMRMEAMKHQGKATSSQLGTKLRTLDAMGKEVDESRNQIHRYIRLTYLIPSILQMVDDGRIAFNPAVEISYMTEEHQTWLKEEMDMCDATPSLVQSRTLKDMSRNGTLTENYLHTLLTEEKPNQRQKFFLNQSDVQQYFPSSYTPQQMQNVIISLLRNWEHKRSSRQHPQREDELER